jgi:hypothetical protein
MSVWADLTPSGKGAAIFFILPLIALDLVVGLFVNLPWYLATRRKPSSSAFRIAVGVFALPEVLAIGLLVTMDWPSGDDATAFQVCLLLALVGLVVRLSLAFGSRKAP